MNHITGPKDKLFRGHTGFTSKGNTRDHKTERLGKVTVYKRGNVYYLYYREGGESIRRRVDGNLASARLAASKVNTAIGEEAYRDYVSQLLPGRRRHSSPDACY